MILRGDALTFQGASPWIPRSSCFSCRTRERVNLAGMCKEYKIREKTNERNHIMDLMDKSFTGVAQLCLHSDHFHPSEQTPPKYKSTPPEQKYKIDPPGIIMTCEVFY